jgi:hypothetical protein
MYSTSSQWVSEKQFWFNARKNTSFIKTWMHVKVSIQKFTTTVEPLITDTLINEHLQ